MRTLDITMAAAVAGLFAVGFYLMLQRSLMRIVFGFVILGHGTNLLLLVAGGGPGKPPIVPGGSIHEERFADPLPQAMALTSIVITFSLTAFLMAMAYRSWRLSGHDEVRDDLEDRLIGTAAERSGYAGGRQGAADTERDRAEPPVEDLPASDPRDGGGPTRRRPPDEEGR